MEEMLFVVPVWGLKKFVIVKKEGLVPKVEKNVWEIKLPCQKMVGLV